MLSRVNRFHGQAALRAVYRRGQTVRAPQLMLKFISNNRPSSRAAVVVGKKVSASAVKRNQIRRRLYEAIREQLPLHGHYDLIFTVFDEQLAAATASAVRTSVKDLLKRAGVFQKNADSGPAVGHDRVSDRKTRET